MWGTGYKTIQRAAVVTGVFTWSEKVVRPEESKAAHAATRFATVDPAVMPCMSDRNRHAVCRTDKDIKNTRTLAIEEGCRRPRCFNMRFWPFLLFCLVEVYIV